MTIHYKEIDMTRKRFREILPEEVAADQPLDEYTLQKMTGNGDYFNQPSNGLGFSLTDWENKDDYMTRWETTSGSLSMSFDEFADNASGLGIIRLTGTGIMRMKDFIPVSQFIGLGGYMVLKTAGLANVSIGVECFDKGYNQSGLVGASFHRYLIADNADLGASFSIYEGILEGEGTGDFSDSAFPQGTRFVKPIIIVNSNDISIDLDSYGFSVLTFSRESLRSRFQ